MKKFLFIFLSFVLIFYDVKSQNIDFSYKENNHIDNNKIDFIDLNNDNYLDVVGIKNDNKIYINYSNTDGTFSIQNDIFEFINTAKLSDIKVANIDDDCKKEIIVSDSENNKLYIVKGNDFEQLEHVRTIDILDNSYYINIADFNNDGNNDIIVFSYTEPRVLTVFLNQNLNPGEFIELSSQEINYGVITDVNQDGNIDLLQNEGSWALGNGDGTFSTIYYNPSYYDSNTGALSDVGDLNGDGYPDLLKHRDAGDAVIILRNNNGTSFSIVLDSWIGENMYQTGGVIGDFNLDGKNDFVTTSWWSKIMRFSRRENDYFAFTYDALELNHNDNAQWNIQWKVIDLDNNGADDIVYKGNVLNVFMNNLEGEYVEDTCNDITNVNNDIIKNAFVVYPNPVKNSLNIINENNQINQIYILDITGKIVITTLLQDTKQVDVSNLKAGVYFVKFEDSIRKFIKE